MERNYKGLILFFLFFSIICLSGFHRSYFQFFPTFQNISWKTHLHFIIFLSWFVVLIIQPYLIYKKKLAGHRVVGKASFVLAPLMVISVLAVVKLRIVGSPNIDAQSLVGITGGVLDCISFSIFYLYSVINKGNLRKHVMGMIGASLIVINPGLGRLVSQLASQELAILVMILCPILSTLFIISYEKFKLGRPFFKNVFWFIILIWLSEVALFVFLPQTGFWLEWMTALFL